MGIAAHPAQKSKRGVMNSSKNVKTVWIRGKNKDFEHHRISKHSKLLRTWVDDAYFGKNLFQYLDGDFVSNLQNEDFFGRLWELELIEYFVDSGYKMIPTNGTGPDFCIELADGKRAWIEATLVRPDDKLDAFWRKAIEDEGEYDTPKKEMALRYGSSLYGKANKIKEKYSEIISEKDYALIAVSAFPPGSLASDMDIFMLAVLPIDNPVVHFTLSGEPLDPNIIRSTHTILREYEKRPGVFVKKEFIYPGGEFPHIDGVMFSEASNLQRLLGSDSSRFGDSTNRPHIFENYSGKDLPEELTRKFYYHKVSEEGKMASIKLVKPIEDVPQPERYDKIA